MRTEPARAQRHQQVREAARAWERAGASTAATREAVERAYPDDRSRLGPVFRVLVFVFTLIAVSSMLGLLGLILNAVGLRSEAALILLFGVGLVAVTELQIGALRRSQGGTEPATAFLGVGYVLGGLLWSLNDTWGVSGDNMIDVALATTALILGVAAWRWGYTIFAVVAAIAVEVLLARAPMGRALWILAGVIAAPLLYRAADSVRLAPSQRRSCEAMGVLSLVFLYVAIHIGSWDQGLVEMVRDDSGGHHPPPALRMFIIVATALTPVLVFLWGVISRRRSLLNLGLVGIVASLTTLRFYVHLAPLWVVLLTAGAAALVAALLIRRLLDRSPGRELHGLTAEPLFTDPAKRSALEIAAGVVQLSPAAQRPPDRPFEAEGGRFGGGGASGNY